MIPVLPYFFLSVCLFVQTCNAALQVTYPEPLDDADNRDNYPIKLLHLILSHVDQDISIKALKTEANQERNLTLIKQGALDVYWSGTSTYRNSELMPIKFPIYKGLLGYRLILVKRENAQLLSAVKDLEDLTKFSIGQGSGWPEVKLYLENNFVVQTTTQYPALFEMLQKGRFDIFPRAIIEIWDEQTTFAEWDLVIDDNILLRYDYAMYFYVSKNNKTLAQLLNAGFSKIIANGEFDKLFEQYIGDYIRRARLNERLLIEIPNPFFESVPAQDKGLYYELR